MTGNGRGAPDAYPSGVVDGLTPLRALLQRENAARAKLEKQFDPAELMRVATDLAAHHGLTLDKDVLRAAISASPSEGLQFASHLPSPGCLPTGIVRRDDRYLLAWDYFGGLDLAAPFFETSLLVARTRPINGLLRAGSDLDGLVRWCDANPGLAPRGFIFHMSRCGSTLVSQMLAASERNLVVSEAPVIDQVVQESSGTARAAGAESLLGMIVRALGQPRRGPEDRYLVKLDSWHTLALPLFRRTFPNVPWVFLYRDPAEVLMSQLRRRGIHTVPSYFSPAMFGMDVNSDLSPEAYCARVLAGICEAAMAHLPLGGGLLVNHRDLPDALFTQILPHFGISCDPGERAIMQRRAQFDAKDPGAGFSAAADRAAKRATPKVAAAVEEWLDGVYARLECLRKTTHHS